MYGNWFVLTVLFGLGGLIGLINKTAKNELKDISLSEERIKCRERTYSKRSRISFLVVFVVLFHFAFFSMFTLMAIDNSSINTNELIMEITFSLFFGLLVFVVAIIIYKSVFEFYKGNISLTTKDLFFSKGVSYLKSATS